MFLLEKLEALTLDTNNERPRLEELLLRRSEDPSVNQEERASAKIMLLVMKKVVQEQEKSKVSAKSILNLEQDQILLALPLQGNFTNPQEIVSKVPGVIRYDGTPGSVNTFLIDLTVWSLASQEKLVQLTHYDSTIHLDYPVTELSENWSKAGFVGIPLV